MITAEPGLPDEAYVAALLALPKLGPARLDALLAMGSGAEVWAHLIEGKPLRLDRVPPEVVTDWRNTARRFDVADRWRAGQRLGVDVWSPAHSRFPDRLRDDLERPVLLFARGRPIGPGPTVAIVGTRQCTSYGRRAAFELGSVLAEAGITVVSGLALGIDAAGHQGALTVPDSCPIGVVGSGLDVVYPRRNRSLWNEVAGRGTLLSEAPAGVRPERWRFPARNRIIAGLADAVIVVESHARGGSLSTVDEAQRRDVPVGAVPGPITSPASAGTNGLLADGAVPVLGPDDVFVMIGYVPPRAGSSELSMPRPGAPSPESSPLLDAMGFEPRLFEQLCLLDPRPTAEVAVEVERLIAAGRCIRTGPWIERVS